LAYPDWWFWRRLPVPAIGRIERAVAESETLHCGEIRVVIEASLDWVPLLRAQSARARALEVFALERVWDTEANNGILIYLLLADRDVEIVADRGMAEVVPHAHWEAICREMEARFGAGRYENALLYGVREVGALLAAHYPRSADTVDSNELPDRPARM
jgi:uncharacterized membrane protein